MTLQATEEDRANYDKLTFLCKQASEAYLQGNVDNALLYYDESIRVSSQDKGVSVIIRVTRYIQGGKHPARRGDAIPPPTHHKCSPAYSIIEVLLDAKCIWFGNSL